MEKLSLELTITLVGFAHMILYVFLERSGKVQGMKKRFKHRSVTRFLLLTALSLIAINILSDYLN
jgi:hypothetical protein